MEPPSSTRKRERTERIIAARAARADKEAEDAMHATLGDALAAALMRYLAGAAPVPAANLKRALALAGYSEELKRLIVRCIEVNPAMEESFLKIAEIAFDDGKAEGREEAWDAY